MLEMVLCGLLIVFLVYFMLLVIGGASLMEEMDPFVVLFILAIGIGFVWFPLHGIAEILKGRKKKSD